MVLQIAPAVETGSDRATVRPLCPQVETGSHKATDRLLCPPGAPETPAIVGNTIRNTGVGLRIGTERQRTSSGEPREAIPLQIAKPVLDNSFLVKVEI